jgi:hypothetical protein
MDHVAVVTVENENVVFKNTSKDGFANGVELSDGGHKAIMWIDDSDADVSVSGASSTGDVTITIGTNGEFGMGPYVVSGGGGLTQITDIDGVIAFVIT